MPEEQRIFPDPKNPGHIPEVIGQLGGVDICFGGIGINGHVAFNEADASLSNEEFLAQQTRVLKITPETRTANAIGDFNGALEDKKKGETLITANPPFLSIISFLFIQQSAQLRG